MESRDLNRMFDALAPTREQEQAVLSRLLQMERKGRPMKKLKKLTVFAVAAALMVISCAAAVVTGLDQPLPGIDRWLAGIDRRLAEHFGAGPEDAELIAPAAAAVNESHTYKNGWMVEISQVLTDRWSVAVLVDVTAPEGTVLESKSLPFVGLGQLDAQGERVKGLGPMMCHYTRLADDSPADGHIAVLWQFRRGPQEENVPFLGGSVEVTPLYVRTGSGENCVQFRDDIWSCTVKLPDSAPEITVPVEEPVSIGENQFRLTSVYLSPLSLTLYLAEGPDKLWSEETGSIRTDWEDNVFINMADGTQLAAAGTQGQIVSRDNQGRYAGSYTFRFDQILNPEEVVSVTLFGQTYKLK